MKSNLSKFYINEIYCISIIFCRNIMYLFLITLQVQSSLNFKLIKLNTSIYFYGRERTYTILVYVQYVLLL